MRRTVLARAALSLLVLTGLLAGSAAAAPLPNLTITAPSTSVVEVRTGLEAGKFCTVVRSCNFSRKAAVRGCLSSYSCRQCDFVKRCSGGRCEWRSRCGWGSAGS